MCVCMRACEEQTQWKQRTERTGTKQGQREAAREREREWACACACVRRCTGAQRKEQEPAQGSQAELLPQPQDVSRIHRLVALAGAGREGRKSATQLRAKQRQRETTSVCVCVCEEEMHRRAKHSRERTGTRAKLASRALTSTTGRVADPPACCLGGRRKRGKKECYPAPV